MSLFAQVQDSEARFDSLCNHALELLPQETIPASRFLKMMSRTAEPLTEIQRARLCYLELKLRENANRGGKATESMPPPFTDCAQKHRFASVLCRSLPRTFHARPVH